MPAADDPHAEGAGFVGLFDLLSIILGRERRLRRCPSRRECQVRRCLAGCSPSGAWMRPSFFVCVLLLFRRRRRRRSTQIPSLGLTPAPGRRRPGTGQTQHTHTHTHRRRRAVGSRACSVTRPREGEQRKGNAAEPTAAQAVTHSPHKASVRAATVASWADQPNLPRGNWQFAAHARQEATHNVV